MSARELMHPCAMRIFLLTALAMSAFAANSLLNRAALSDGAIGPADFAAIRVISGALALAVMVWLRRKGALQFDVKAAGALLLYAVGFSFAYGTLDAGVGALILFGGVQVTMFAGAIAARDTLPVTRWIGAGIAFLGLVYLLWPGGVSTPSLSGSFLMLAAAVGWGIYSLIGRTASNPLAATAGNFILAAPVALMIWLGFSQGGTGTGILLAVISGVVTSGLGYALWYAVLPKLEASIAGIAQLTVPLIAVAGGALLLGEPLTLRFAIATVLVIVGVLISLRKA